MSSFHVGVSRHLRNCRCALTRQQGPRHSHVSLCVPLSAKTAIPTTKPKPKGAAAPDKPVCRFFLKPDGCKNGDNCQYAHPRTNGKCLRCGSESDNLQACACPRRQQSSRSNSVKSASKKTYAKPRGKAADTQGSNPGSQEKKKSKGKSKGKGSQTKPTAKSGNVDFDDNAQAEQDDQDDEQEHDELQEDDPRSLCDCSQNI